MAVSSKVGTLNTTTGAAASTVVVTGLGFQPKVILFWWSGLTAANTGARGTSLRGMGFACSASNFMAAASFDADAVGTASAIGGQRSDACIVELDATTFVGWADLQSFDSDGFTLEIIDQFSTNLLVNYLALGGTSITAAECGIFTAAGAAPTNQTVNNVGNFQPAITFFLSSQVAANLPAVANDSTLSLGVATSSSDEQMWLGGSNQGSTTMITATYALSGEILAQGGTLNASLPTRAEFVSHNAGTGGFTINWLERATALRVGWCSIAGGDWAAGNFLTRTDGNDIAVTGLASQPAAMLFVSGCQAAATADGTPASQDEWSMGAATGVADRVVQQIASRSGNTDSFVHLAARTDAVYINSGPANASYTLEALMDLKSVESTGFTCVMDDVDFLTAYTWYVAVGPAAAATSSVPVFMNQYRQRRA